MFTKKMDVILEKVRLEKQILAMKNDIDIIENSYSRCFSSTGMFYCLSTPGDESTSRSMYCFASDAGE